MAGNVKKISIALGPEEFAWARQRARREGSSVSAVLTEAARRMRAEEVAEARRRKAALDYEAWAASQNGPLTEIEVEAARKELAGGGASRRPRRAASR